MASSTRNPSASASIVTGWSNISNVYSSDDTWAVASLTTAVMAATGFGFALPTGSTILGIEIVTEYKGSGNNTSRRELTVQITKNGSTGVGTASSFSATVTNTDQIFTVGGPTNLLGNTLTAAEVNASTFGVLLRPSNVGSYARSVDHVYLVVYYEPPALNAEPATQEVSGLTGSLIKLSNITGDLGEVLLTGVDSILVWDSNIYAASDSYAITGIDATLDVGAAPSVDNVLKDSTDDPITDSTGEQILTGGPYDIDAQPEVLNITGADAVLERFYEIPANPDSIIITGIDADITYQSSTPSDNILYDSNGDAILDSDGDWILTDGPYTLPTMVGSLVITGSDAQFIEVSGLAASPGETLLTGISSTITSTRNLSLAPGVVSLSGSSAVITAIRQSIADSDTIVITGVDASGSTSIGGFAEAGSISITGFPQFDNILRDDTGDPILDDFGNFIFTDTVAILATGEISITGAVATLAKASVVPATSGNVIVTGSLATLSWFLIANAIPGTTGITGYNAGTIAALKLSSSPGSITLSGVAASLARQLANLTATAGAITLSGQPSTERRTYATEAVAGVYAIEGYAVEFDLTAAEQILTANSGEILLTGQLITVDREGAADFGTLSISGQSTTNVRSLVFIADAGVVSVNGVAVTETLTRVFQASSGTIQTIGSNVTIINTRVILPETGLITVTGSDVSVTATRKLSATAGTIALTGSNATVYAGLVLNSVNGTVLLEGYDPSIVTTRNIDAQAGAYVVDGYPASFDLITVEKIIYANPGNVAISGESIVIDRVGFAGNEIVDIYGVQATLSIGIVLFAESGTVILSGEAATIIATRELQNADTSIYVTGSSASTIVARAVEAAYAAIGITGFDGTLVVSSDTEFALDVGNYDFNGVEAFAILVRALMAGSGQYSVSGYTVYAPSSQDIGTLINTSFHNLTTMRTVNNVSIRRDIVNKTIKRTVYIE